MAKFVKFPRKDSPEIWVNVDHIQIINTNLDGTTSYMILDGWDTDVTVNLPYDKVVEMING